MPEMSGSPQVDINLGAESCFVFEVTKHKTCKAGLTAFTLSPAEDEMFLLRGTVLFK